MSAGDGEKVVKVAVLLRLDDDIDVYEVGSVELTAPDNARIAALLRRLADEMEVQTQDIATGGGGDA